MTTTREKIANILFVTNLELELYSDALKKAIENESNNIRIETIKQWLHYEGE